MFTLTENRIRIIYGLYALILSVLCIIGIIRTWECEGGSDFVVHWKLANYIWTNGVFPPDCYVDRYPPAGTLILSLFFSMPLKYCCIAWNILNLLALYHLPFIFVRISGISLREQLTGWLIVLPYIADNLVLSGFGPVLVWTISLFVWSVLALPVLEGLSLIIGICFKLTPIIFFPFIMFTKGFYKNIKYIVLGFVLSLALFCFLCKFMLVNPENEITRTTKNWAFFILNQESPTSFIYNKICLRSSNESVLSVLARLFCSDVTPANTGEDMIKLADIDPVYILAANRAVSITAVLIWCIVFYLTLRKATSLAIFRLFGMTSILMMILSPLVWYHHFIYCAPSMIYLTVKKGRWTGLVSLVPYIGMISFFNLFGVNMLAAFSIYLVSAFDSFRENMIGTTSFTTFMLRNKYIRCSYILVFAIICTGSFISSSFSIKRFFQIRPELTRFIYLYEKLPTHNLSRMVYVLNLIKDPKKILISSSEEELLSSVLSFQCLNIERVCNPADYNSLNLAADYLARKQYRVYLLLDNTEDYSKQLISQCLANRNYVIIDSYKAGHNIYHLFLYNHYPPSSENQP